MNPAATNHKIAQHCAQYLSLNFCFRNLSDEELREKYSIESGTLRAKLMRAIVQATREELDTDEVSYSVPIVESGTMRAKLMRAIVQATREELDTDEVSYSFTTM